MLHEARLEPLGEPLLPLSLAQRDVWHAQLLEPGSATYNIGGYVEIDGPVDRAAFDRAVRRVIDEADSHNLLFVDTPIGVHQQMRPGYVEVPLIDVGRAEDPQAAAVAWMRGALLRPFDLVQGPLYRHALLKLADDRFAWFAGMHHLVTDAFGMLRFIRRLGDAYSTEVDSQPRPREPATSWTEFLRDEVRYCESARYERDRCFWRERLASCPDAATLSGKPPGRPGQTIVSTGCIPAPVLARLEEVAARCDATPVALMLAATAAHLARLSGRRDIVLGMPVSGRTSGALRRVYGFVSNVVPLRLDVDPYASFTALVRQAGVRAREAFRHQRYPAASLRRDLGLVADAPSLYGSVINFLPEEVACRFGEHAGRLHMFTHASRVEDMLLTVHASGEAGLRIQFDANEARYDQASLEHIQRSFLCLLGSVAQDPDGVTALLPIVSPADRQQLLHGGASHARTAPPPRCLHELLEGQTARTPDAIALVRGADALTYGELNAQANRVAHRLIAAGVGPEVLVGLCVERSPAMIVGMLAISKAGGAYLPLDPTYPDVRLRHMLADARPALLVGSERALGTWGQSLRSQLPPQLILDSDSGAMGAGEDAVAGNNPTDLERLAPLRAGHAAYVIYTSGSTGTPKGVVVTHAGLSALAAASVEHFRIEATSRVLQYSSINFDVSVSEVVMALGAGAALVLAPPEASSGAALEALLADQRITHLSLPAAVLPTLNAGADLALQCLIVGGEACAPGLIAAWSDTVRLINAYGPTESTVCATLSAPLQGAVVAPLGRAIEGSRVYVLDASLEPVPWGAQGELYIAGIGLARGYLGRPALTAERFVPDPHGAPGSRMYRTGDVVLRRADGDLEFVGRTDQQIKLRGFRVELGEVDCALNSLAGVDHAVSVVREDVPGLRVLAAYVVPRVGHDVSAATLRSALAQRLPAPMIPTQWMLLASLPLTANGKLDRHALPRPGEESDASCYEAPRTPTEERLAAVWRDILHTERIGRTDDFFELGGHSLIALQVIARIRDLFDLELPLQELFDARTLDALARRIDLAAAREHAPRLAAIRAHAASGPAPLSYSQERMWLIQSLNPQTTAYNMAAALRIRGHVDAGNMAVCFDRLFERHEILRSSIRLRNELPTQVVESGAETRLQRVDLRGEQDPQAEAQRRAEELTRAPFDLGSEPVIRLGLFQTGDAAYWLVIVLHHIAGDQWSMGVLGRELASLYNHRRRGLECSLPPLPVSYRDYSLWQRSAAFTAQFEQQLGFWRHKLADLPTVDLPTDHVRPRVWTLHGSYLDRKIPPTLFDKLQRFSRRSGVTLFMTSFAAFAVLLQRITAQQDIPIGVPVANRTHSTLEGLVGTFVNTVVLRNDLSGDPTFDALLQRVRGTALEAFARQDVSFDRLVQDMGQRGDRSRAPLAQVLFNVTNAPMHGLSMDGLEWEPVELDRGGAQFELSMSVDTEIGRKVTVEYNTDLFERATIERWVGQYFTLLEAVADGSARRISTLPLLPAEQWATLQAWNATQISYPRRRVFPQLFEEQAARSPLRTAVTFEGAACSYGDLNSQANRVARRLQALGVGPGELVAVCAERSPLLLVSLIAIQKSGAAYLPLDPDFPVERLRYMLCDSGVKVMLMAGRLPPGLALPEGIAALDVATAVSGAGGAAAADAAAVGDVGDVADAGDVTDVTAVADVANVSGGATAADPAYVIYTSGSTGRPKGVAVSHGALLNFLYSMRDRPGLCAADVLAAVTTISFDIAALELYLPLMVGARIELVSRRTATDGEALAGVLRACGATLLQATPATWRMLLEAAWSPMPTFRALSGGEPLPRSLADSLLDRVGELWNLYGPTETTVWSTIERIERGTAAISIGRPIANTQVHILDAHGQVVPIGVVGEICIGGAGVATGYHRRPALTAERFVPDPYSDVNGSRLYRTGDLGRWQDDRLYHCGRADFQVKIRGFRIELGEIEQVLSAHPAVRQAVVAVRDAQQDDSRLVAYVVYREGAEPTISDMKRHLRGELPDYMVPSIVMSLRSIPLTPNGKLDRAALPDPFASLQAPTSSHDPPTTAAEKIVAEIWQSVLKRERVEAGDNFFELGGYSLLSLRVAKLLEKRTRYRMDPRALFFNNLRQIAALIDAESPR